MAQAAIDKIGFGLLDKVPASLDTWIYFSHTHILSPSLPLSLSPSIYLSLPTCFFLSIYLPIYLTTWQSLFVHFRLSLLPHLQTYPFCSLSHLVSRVPLGPLPPLSPPPPLARTSQSLPPFSGGGRWCWGSMLRERGGGERGRWCWVSTRCSGATRRRRAAIWGTPPG